MVRRPGSADLEAMILLAQRRRQLGHPLLPRGAALGPHEKRRAYYVWTPASRRRKLFLAHFGREPSEGCQRGPDFPLRVAGGRSILLVQAFLDLEIVAAACRS